jgi:DNA-directed RNA polymerase specialized sigma24 family protein
MSTHLAPETREQIRQLWKNRPSHKTLAQQHGVSVGTIRSAIYGRRYVRRKTATP